MIAAIAAIFFIVAARRVFFASGILVGRGGKRPLPILPRLFWRGVNIGGIAPAPGVPALLDNHLLEAKARRRLASVRPWWN